jgi:alpha-L-rhamnosidase
VTMLAGSWVWVGAEASRKDAYVYLRKELTLGGTLRSATFRVTACQRYRLWRDGELLGEGPCPAMPHQYTFDTYRLDVRELAEVSRKGAVCLSAVCYHIGNATRIVTDQNQGLPGFRFDAEFIYEDGTVRTIASDSSWKAIPSPTKPADSVALDESRISLWGGFRQLADLRAEPTGWQEPGFDDGAWSNAVLVQGADECFTSLSPRSIPFMEGAIVQPVSVVQVEPSLGSFAGAENLLDASPSTFATADATRPGSFPAVVLDFGRETVGYVELDLRGMRGANASLWYGESLDMQRVDTVILSGGLDRFRPFHLRAFRFLRLVINNSTMPVEVLAVRVRTATYPYEDRGRFSCSDPLLERIVETSAYTVKMNSLEHFVDCPWREQAQWMADARVMALGAYYAFGSYDLARKCILQFFAEQDPDGFLPATGPQTPKMTLLDFPLHFVMMIEEYAFHSGDQELVREIAGSLDRLMGFYVGLEDADGLIVDRLGKGLFLDWANVDKRGQVTALNCLYVQALRTYSGLLRGLGRDREAGRFETRSERVREAVQRLLFDVERGLYCDCRVDGVRSAHFSQQSTMYAVFTGTAPESQADELISRAFSTNGIETIKGAFLLSFATARMFRTASAQAALDMIRDYWGAMLRRGATTWWETFDRTTPETAIPYVFAGNTPTFGIDYIPVSHCHAWGCGPAFSLPREVLGVRPVAAGFREIEIDPFPGDLTWCRGTVPTPLGDIQAEWEIATDGRVHMKVKLPHGVRVVRTGPESKMTLEVTG